MCYGLDEVETFSKENIGKLFYEANDFWQKRRKLYNILVGISGIFCLLNFEIYHFFILNILGVLFYGITANAFYSFGSIFENWIIIKSKGKKSLGFNREVLFWVGTLFSIFITSFCCIF
jgi:hypothetical protein